MFDKITQKNTINIGEGFKLIDMRRSEMIVNKTKDVLEIFIRSYSPEHEWTIELSPEEENPLKTTSSNRKEVNPFSGLNISISNEELYSEIRGDVNLRIIPGNILKFDTSGGTLMIDQKEQ